MKIKFSVENLLLFLIALPAIVFALVSFVYELLMIVFILLFISHMQGGAWESTMAGIVPFLILCGLTVLQIKVVKKIFRKEIRWGFAIAPTLLVALILFIWIYIFMPNLNFNFALKCVKLDGQQFSLSNIQKLGGYCSSDSYYIHKACTSDDIGNSLNGSEYLGVWSKKKEEPQLFCGLQNTKDGVRAQIGSYFD
jgi:hypothetical protein